MLPEPTWVMGTGRGGPSPSPSLFSVERSPLPVPGGSGVVSAVGSRVPGVTVDINLERPARIRMGEEWMTRPLTSDLQEVALMG